MKLIQTLLTLMISSAWLSPTQFMQVDARKQQKVLLIGLDGMRWDYLEKNKDKLPNMVKLQQQGVRAKYVKNVFPTNTLPNFHSVVTGLYPDNHGIVDNQMYNEKTKTKFSMKHSSSDWWNEAEPIWVTNQREGHESGLCYWPGFGVKIKNILPTYAAENKKYGNPLIDFDSELMPHKERIDLVIRWFVQKKVTFAAIYFEDLDTNLHSKGAKSSYSNSLQNLDEAFGYLKKQLDGAGLNSDVNVIVVGDHGGKDVDHSKMIRLNDYLDTEKYIETAMGKTFVSVFPKPGQLEAVYNTLVKAHPHMTAYYKHQLPTHMHIKNNKYTAPLLLLADPGWLIDSGFEKGVYFQGQKFHKGEHGYSIYNNDMHPGFFAFGPCFKDNFAVDSISILDLYPTMCKIIGLKPQKNDGSLEALKVLMNKKCM